MSDALHTLFEEMIDYAGLFPPAKLDLDAALRQYSYHRSSKERWMLGRFIVPASRLTELSGRMPEVTGLETPFRLVLLIGGGTIETQALEQIRVDAEVTGRFMREFGNGVVIEAAETRIPLPTLETASRDAVQAYVEAVRTALVGSPLAETPIFFEAAATEHGVEGDRVVADSLERASHAGIPVGFKLRCGGPAAADVPSVPRVASVMLECRERHLPLKCTAGLHHPLYGDHRGPARPVTPPASTSSPEDSKEYAREMDHGFLNLLAAAALAHARALPAAKIEECLAEEKPSHFRFEPDALTWHGYAVDTVQIQSARQRFLLGFGSCSVDEPVGGLRDLGFAV